MLLEGSTGEKDVKIALDRLHQAKFRYEKKLFFNGFCESLKFCKMASFFLSGNRVS
jgi:hypothetical protein